MFFLFRELTRAFLIGDPLTRAAEPALELGFFTIILGTGTISFGDTKREEL